MQTITFTELRKQSKKLKKALEEGKSIDLIHRSKVVGKIKPVGPQLVKIIDAKKLQKKIDKLDLPTLTLKEMDRRYRIAMMKKHGQGLR